MRGLKKGAHKLLIRAKKDYHQVPFINKCCFTGSMLISLYTDQTTTSIWSNDSPLHFHATYALQCMLQYICSLHQ